MIVLFDFAVLCFSHCGDKRGVSYFLEQILKFQDLHFQDHFFEIQGQFQEKWQFYKIPGVFQDKGQIQGFFSGLCQPSIYIHVIIANLNSVF